MKEWIAESIIVIIIIIVILIGLLYFINKIEFVDKTDWKYGKPLLQYRNWNTEQRIYYKIFIKEIKRESPLKKDSEVDFIATMLVTQSKYIPYFAALVWTESVLPGKWKKRKHRYVRVRKPQLWHNFTMYNDGGSRSIGYVKIKWSTIKAVCRARGERIPRSIYEIDIHKIYWKIKIFDWAGWHFDNLIKQFNNCELDGLGAYKYGPNKYRRWKKRRWKTAYPWKYIGDAMRKVIRYQKLFINYDLMDK